MVSLSSATAAWTSESFANHTGTAPRPCQLTWTGTKSIGGGPFFQIANPFTVLGHKNGRGGPPGNAGVKSSLSRRLKSAGMQLGSRMNQKAIHSPLLGENAEPSWFRARDE